MKPEINQDNSESSSEDSTEQHEEQGGEQNEEGGYDRKGEYEEEGDINVVREAYRRLRQRLQLKEKEGAAKDKAIELLTTKNKFYEKKLNQMEESVEKFEIILKTLAMDQASPNQKTLSFQPYRPYDNYPPKYTPSRPSYSYGAANAANGSYTCRPEGLEICCRCRGASTKMGGNMSVGVRGGRSALGGMDQYRRERIMSMTTADGVLRIQGLYH